jgi:hypothetical protein
MKNLDLLERPQAIVDAGVNLQHVQPRLDEGNRRQEVLPLQTVRIESVGRVIRSHHEHHPAREECFEQATEDHRIGDVGDVKFVKTEQPHFAGQPFGHLQEGIALALEFVQLAMDAMHEGVKVDTPFATVGHRVKEAVHQEALAAPDAAPEINATRHCRRSENAPQGTATPDLEREQIVVKALQTLGSRALRRVSLEIACREQALVGIDHAPLGDFENSMRHQRLSAIRAKILVLWWLGG